MISQQKQLVIIIVILGLIIGGIIGCSQNQAQPTTKSQPPKQEQVTPVEVTLANVGKVIKSITVTGQAKPLKKVQITPQLQAKVENVLVEVGDKVKTGSKLLQLNQENFKIQVEQAKARLDVAQANLNKLLAGTREEKIAQLKAQLKQTKVNYKQAKSNYERHKKLFEKEIISQQQLEASKSRYISAKSSYQSTKESLEMAKEGATKEQIAVLKAQINQAKKGMEAAQLRLDKAIVTAPISGTVAKVEIEEGEIATPKPLISLVNLNQVIIETYISEQNITKLNLGQQVAINISALDKNFTGKIMTISPVIDPVKKKYLVKIKINNPGPIKAGMYAKVKIQTDQSLSRIVIPQQAVMIEDNNRYVYLVKGNRVVKEIVKTGLTAQGKVAILNGINLGEKVITNGLDQVTSGDRVRVINRGDE
ncbi:RND family efflux transporter, MFP subunit [Halobacteroides halobius DSM 5150]|uniref:RND family efflux transporter, MFP subunit n=1 Tax=Halobacteroides halobius (strain ATCC 35273 / DSM 5150 / MD-1) TaxID=748449 RepID=L0KAE5_HALHC|nr:efflux RND transporter periplasmic adaptor subunit [Halobacteroides halobius]AGB41515.1 RND family efflux transporter, MFP subunit [Halobacteroides halobius DSM 5150]